MRTKITIDEAGRLVIPKSYREEFHIEPGDSLQLESSGAAMILRPVYETIPLRKENGFWVYRTGHPLRLSIADLIDRDREERIRQIFHE